MSYHTGGMNMRTTMGRTMNRTTMPTRSGRTNVPPRTSRTITPRRNRMVNNGRMLNGTGARGVRRTAGQFGRGGVRTTPQRRPRPIMRTNTTNTPIITRTQVTGARGRINPSLGVVGRSGVDGHGRNI